MSRNATVPGAAYYERHEHDHERERGERARIEREIRRVNEPAKLAELIREAIREQTIENREEAEWENEANSRKERK